MEKVGKSNKLIVGSIVIIILLCGVFLYPGIGKSNASDKNLLLITKEKSQDNFGAAMPRVGFVNDRMLILYDSIGVYIFDLLSDKLVDYINFEEHKLDAIQGDNPTFVEISKSGEYIYLHNNEIELIYGISAKKFNYSEFNSDNIEFWNPQIVQDYIENDTYYNVGRIFQLEDNKKCFLAIRKNMNPNYSALICIISNEQSAQIHTLFN